MGLVPRLEVPTGCPGSNSHYCCCAKSLSTEMSDVNRAYQLGAKSFFVKELDFQGNVDLRKLFQKYWFTKARNPKSARHDRKPNDHGH